MKSTRILLLFALTLVVTPTLLAADFGVRAGRFNDSDQKFVGAELLFNLGAVNLNPNLEYSLEDDVTAGTANLDFTFDVLSTPRVRPFVGAGVGLAYLDDDFGDTRTDVVGNLIGGLAFDLQSIKPYAQVKYVRVLDNDDEDSQSEDDLALIVGLRF
ncbi:MAG TPA: hypothetical protein VHW00_10630 [Thermoanaerobaculia bacterium]|nr:hypothetical protein [Thermoanaerobaculia bacterium]